MVCKCHTETFRPEICVKMFIFKVAEQSDHLETKCSWIKVSQGKNVTVDISSGTKCHSGRNVGGRNIKASNFLLLFFFSFGVQFYILAHFNFHETCSCTMFLQHGQTVRTCKMETWTWSMDMNHWHDALR
jgi:hypothetical protein